MRRIIYRPTVSTPRQESRCSMPSASVRHRGIPLSDGGCHGLHASATTSCWLSPLTVASRAVGAGRVGECQLLLDRCGDLRGNCGVGFPRPVSHDVHEISELIHPILLEHAQVFRNDSLLNRVEGHVVRSSPHIADPVVHRARRHVECIGDVFAEAIAHLIAGLADVARAAVFSREQAVHIATHGEAPRARKEMAQNKYGLRTRLGQYCIGVGSPRGGENRCQKTSDCSAVFPWASRVHSLKEART